MQIDRVLSQGFLDSFEKCFHIFLGHSEIGMTMRYVKIAEHYKVEAVVRLETYRAAKMQEAVVKMQEEQQEAEKMGMLQ